MDYSEDPNPYVFIWRNPNPTSVSSPTAHQDLSAPLISISPLVTTVPDTLAFSLPFATLSIDFLDLDCPPLSPTTLHLLISCSSSSPPFETSPSRNLCHMPPFIPPTSVGFISMPRIDLLVSSTPSIPTAESNPSSIPSSCFKTLVIKV